MTRFLFGAAAAAVVAGAAMAAQPAPPPQPGVAQGTAPVAVPAPPHVRTFVHRLPKLETRDQVVAHVRDMFARLDGNKDGYVSREEADGFHRAMAESVHKKFEKRTGDLPRPDRGAMFDKLDTNKDGSISRQEYVSARPDVRERRVFVMRDGDGPAEIGGGPGRPHVDVMRLRGPGMRGRMFERADANRDGRVSLQEMTDAALKHFDSADANRDGKLTPDERLRGHKGRRVHVQRIPA